MPLALPHAFGRYTLTQRIGEGGMAEVFLAQVTVAEGLSKRVVIKKIRKELADQPEFTRMFVDEAKIALGLNHANIVQVFDFGQVHGGFFLAMELVEGVDLMRLLHRVHERGERVPVFLRRRPASGGFDGVDGAGKTVFADALGDGLRAIGLTVMRSGIDGTASSFHKCNDDGVNLFRCQLRRFHESGERHG